MRVLRIWVLPFGQVDFALLRDIIPKKDPSEPKAIPDLDGKTFTKVTHCTAPLTLIPVTTMK